MNYFDPQGKFVYIPGLLLGVFIAHILDEINSGITDDDKTIDWTYKQDPEHKKKAIDIYENWKNRHQCPG